MMKIINAVLIEVKSMNIYKYKLERKICSLLLVTSKITFWPRIFKVKYLGNAKIYISLAILTLALLSAISIAEKLLWGVSLINDMLN